MDGGRAEDGRGRLIRPAGGGGRSKLPLELMNLCEQKERRRVRDCVRKEMRIVESGGKEMRLRRRWMGNNMSECDLGLRIQRVRQE